MTRFAYDTTPAAKAALGLVVLQADETLELDFRRMLAPDVPFYTSRVPSGEEVTPETLQAMADHLSRAAGLLPGGAPIAAIGYGCTSGAAQIGTERVAELIRAGRATGGVSEPVTALVAACRALGLRSLAFLSPYTAKVSDRLRDVLRGQGIETPRFGSFEEAEEARVVRIAPASIRDAAVELARQGAVDAVFLSCTNLRTLDLIEEVERATGLPCLSSNQVLCWHLARLARITADVPGRLGRLPVAPPRQSRSSPA